MIYKSNDIEYVHNCKSVVQWLTLKKKCRWKNTGSFLICHFAFSGKRELLNDEVKICQQDQKL